MTNELITHKKRVLFVGIPDMAFICLDGLRIDGVNIVGVVGPKKDHPTYFTFRDFVRKRGLNYIEYDELDEESLIDQVKSLDADIAVVCSFNYKIPKVLLDTAKGGFINVHPSLLPKYKGANPYSHVIFNNEEKTGVTLHFMDEKFDTGDIIIQRELMISSADTMGTLFNRLNIMGLELLIQTLRAIEEGPLPRTPQPKGDFVKSKKIYDDDIEINYNKPAEEIERFLRGLNPFFAASTTFRKSSMKIFSAEVLEEDSALSEYSAGTIAKIEGDKFYIATSKGLLAPTVIQFGSFFIGSSKDFINILNPKIGETFK